MHQRTAGNLACIFIHRIFFADNVTIYFLKNILGRKKAYLHNEAVKTLHVPQYKNLSLEKILIFVCE